MADVNTRTWRPNYLGLVRNIRLALEDLRRLAPEWEGVDSAERGWFVEEDWEPQMWQLRCVAEDYQAGKLKPEEAEEYLGMRAEAEALLPTIRRLGLEEPELPPVSPEEAHHPKVAEGQLEELLLEGGQLPGRDYLRGYRISEDLPPMTLAWPKLRRAAQLYRDREQARAERAVREEYHGRGGWETLVLTEDIDLLPQRRELTRGALLRWSRGEDE